MQNQIPNRILNHKIDGLNLHGDTLRVELGKAPTLLVFLRHFG